MFVLKCVVSNQEVDCTLKNWSDSKILQTLWQLNQVEWHVLFWKGCWIELVILNTQSSFNHVGHNVCSLNMLMRNGMNYVVYAILHPSHSLSTCWVSRTSLNHVGHYVCLVHMLNAKLNESSWSRHIAPLTFILNLLDESHFFQSYWSQCVFGLHVECKIEWTMLVTPYCILYTRSQLIGYVALLSTILVTMCVWFKCWCEMEWIKLCYAILHPLHSLSTC